MMMINNIEIITTIGHSSCNKKTLIGFKNKSVDFFRINLSHIPSKEIEKKIIELKGYGVPIMIDTEGRQIRTGNKKEIKLIKGEKIKLYDKKIKCDKNSLFLTPLEVIKELRVGDYIYPDFNSVEIKIEDCTGLGKKYIEGKIIRGGKIGGRKGVYVKSVSKLEYPPFSDKDLYAIELAKKYKIENFSLSFINNAEDIKKFLDLYPKASFIPKIETKKAIQNLEGILETSDKFLIDRGDLSKEIALSKIPSALDYIIKKSNSYDKKIFIATNTLDSMYNSINPNISEVQDIVSCLDMGVRGFVLTKETAIGKNPLLTVEVLSKMINEYFKNQNLVLSQQCKFLIDE